MQPFGCEPTQTEPRAAVAGGGFTSKRGTFGSVGKMETMMSVSYGRVEELVFSGAATGDIYIWKETLLLRTVKAHDGPVFAMHALDKVSSPSCTFAALMHFTGGCG